MKKDKKVRKRKIKRKQIEKKFKLNDLNTTENKVNNSDNNTLEMNSKHTVHQDVALFVIGVLIVCICGLYINYKRYDSKPFKDEKEYATLQENSLHSIVNIKKLAIIIDVNSETTIEASLDKYYDERLVNWETKSNIISLENCSKLKCQIKTSDIEGEAVVTASYIAGYDKEKYTNVDSIIIKVVKKEAITFYKYSNEGYNFYTMDKLSSPNSSIQESNDYKKISTYNCIKANCEVKSFGNYHALIYDDDTYYEFNYNSTETKENKEIKKLNSININMIDNSKKVLGYDYQIKEGDNYNHYIYSNVLNKTIKQCNFFFSQNQELLENNIILYTNTNSKLNVLNLENGNVEKELDFKIDYNLNITSYRINNQIIYGLSNGIFKDDDIIFIDNDYNELFNGRKFHKAHFYNDLLYTIDTNAKEYVVYNLDGSVKETNSNYKKVLDLYDKFILVVDNDNHLTLLNYDGSTEIELYDWESKYSYISLVSGYRDYYSSKEIEYPIGYYIVLENDEVEYGAKGHAIKIYYDNDNKKKIVTEEFYTGAEGKAKPILYLYPKKKTKVKVQLEGFSTLTTTYPKYKNYWEVTANSNGDLYDENGKYYYGLYWEEETPRKVNFSSGFYVEAKDAIIFLEEKLEYIGLSSKERNEFIMYWLPILEKNEKNLVYFEQTKELEENTHLNIKPIPDTLIRLTIHVKKVNTKINITPQKLIHYNRKGFVVVEWGGINYE